VNVTIDGVPFYVTTEMRYAKMGGYTRHDILLEHLNTLHCIIGFQETVSVDVRYSFSAFLIRDKDTIAWQRKTMPWGAEDRWLLRGDEPRLHTIRGRRTLVLAGSEAVRFNKRTNLKYLTRAGVPELTIICAGGVPERSIQAKAFPELAGKLQGAVVAVWSQEAHILQYGAVNLEVAND